MVAQRQPDVTIVLDDLSTGGHWAQRNARFVELRNGHRLSGGSGGEERQRFVTQRLDLPKRFPARQAHGRPEGIGLGKFDQAGRRHAGAVP